MKEILGTVFTVLFDIVMIVLFICALTLTNIHWTIIAGAFMLVMIITAKFNIDIFEYWKNRKRG